MSLLKDLKTIFFSNSKDKTNPLDMNNYESIKFNIAVIEFSDNVESNNGENLTEILKTKQGLKVSCFDESFPKNFLSLESKHLFDFIDKGQYILEKTNADILVWGYREGDKIRLNFQNYSQYEKDENTFISLLDSLYIPADLLNDKINIPSSVSNLIYGSIISAIDPKTKEEKIYKKYLLKKVIDQLSKDSASKNLSIDYMPYVMNFLGIIYLSYAYDNGNEKDFNITKNLFETAIKHQDLIKNHIHLGCIYYHLGQLYDNATEHMANKPTIYYKGAINSYRLAQKYLSKYNSPYDYAYISYKLSHLYFNYWKRKEDIQAIRDCVFHLREVEKIYTYSLFPEFWSEIQGEIGYSLSIFGNVTQNTEISELAIAGYKNQQKIITEKRDPINWAKIQENIGNIYYKIGKNKNDKTMLEESLEYFHDALYIFENIDDKEKSLLITTSIAKTSQALNSL